MDDPPADGFVAKTILAVEIWLTYLGIILPLRREPLADLVARVGRPARKARFHHEPRRISRAIHRVLRMGPYRPRCLPSAVVMYRLLRRQGDAAELVIGLPDRGTNQIAHAWVEIDGRDVGPPPGRGIHAELARFS